MQADYITLESYGDIDLDTDPVIVPSCGHVITVSSLDGFMDMTKYYTFGEGNTVTALVNASVAFSAENDMKTCPGCRASLRNIQRYSRIIRRAVLDESSKRFIVWSSHDYLQLEAEFVRVQEIFLDATIQVSVQSPVELRGTTYQQFNSINRCQMFSKVYKEAMSLRRKIDRHVRNVQKEEQPYHRVRALVEDARRRKKVTPVNMPLELQTVQMGQSVRAAALMLRFDLALLGKFINVKQNTKQAMATVGPKLTVNFTVNREDCLKLVDAAQQAKMPAQQAEGHILFARYLALELSVAHSASEDAANLDGDEIMDNATTEQVREQSRQDGYQHLQEARQLCDTYPGQCKTQTSEIEPAEQALRGFFMAEVTNEERQAVLAAMAKEFLGTGHWYTCENGHPFSIGECGMPMETARCPECGASIGGTDHTAVQGTQRAEELERELAAMRI